VSPKLSLKAVSLLYRWKQFERLVLDQVDLAVDAGEFISLTGPNGSGKSSILKLFLGLIAVDSGEVWIDEIQVKGGEPRPLDEMDIAYLPQDPLRFFMGETVRQELQAARGLGDGVEELARRYDLTRLLDQPVRHLSGGERQRLGLAAFLAPERSILLLDEPSSFLDHENTALLREALLERTDGRHTILHVTQYSDEVEWGNAHLVLMDGKLVRQ